MQLPFMVPSEEPWSVSGVAVAALIRSGDDTIAQTVNAATPIDRIVRLRFYLENSPRCKPHTHMARRIVTPIRLEMRAHARAPNRRRSRLMTRRSRRQHLPFDPMHGPGAQA